MKAILIAHYPQAVAGISTPFVSWTPDGTNSLTWAATEAAERSLGADAPTIESTARDVVREMETFLQSERVPMLTIGEVVGTVLSEEVPDPSWMDEQRHVSLRRLTYDLVYRYGLGISPWSAVPRLYGCCCICVEYDVPVRFGTRDLIGGGEVDAATRRANNLLCALQTTSTDSTTMPRLMSCPRDFTLLPLTMSTYNEVGKPGTMVLRSEGLTKCAELFRGLESGAHASLRLACSRLGRSRSDLRPEDAVMDAAIGLEAILLHRAGKHELGFRLALRYALLSPDTGTRRTRFALAKAFYDIRSAIAHGDQPEPPRLRACGGSVVAAAEIGQSMLSECIDRFRPNMHRPEFSRDDFWDEVQLGIEAPADREPGAPSQG